MHGMCRATHFRMNKNQEEDEFIAVRVQDPRIQNEGSWSSYVDFKIFLHTNSKAFTAKTSCVRRRYSEFVWLKKKLQKNSGLVPVPDLPGKTLFFSFNEDLIERRRRGLQNFLDKVVHMTVCLSDSQLHLFLQTQLPVGHIEDCVHGLTPYTVTDAILTYASSNRGWAQEEEGVVQEPGLSSVSYESVDSPAPHLPSLQTEETYEFRASEADTHGEDLLETSHEGKHFNEKDVLKVDVHEINSCMIMGTEASVEEKCVNEQGVLNIDVHKTNSNAIRETEASMEEKCINERSVLKAVTLECKTCVSEAIEAGIEEQDTSEEHSFEGVIRETEASIEEKCINEQGVLEVVTLEHKTCVSEAIEAGIEEQDTSEEHSFEGVIRETEASIEERCINEQDVLEVVTLEHKPCVTDVMEAGIEEKDTCEEHSFEEDAEETKTCVAGAMKGAGEEPVHEARAHDNNPVPDTRPYLLDSDTCILKVTPAQAKEGPLKEENFSEEDVYEEDIQDINIHKFEEMLGTIQENEASEDPVCQAYTHVHKSKPDTQDVDTFKVTTAHAYEENLCEEVVHKEDVQEINMHEFEEMLGTIQENEASEEPVHQAHTHVHKSKPGTKDLDTSKVTAAHAYEEDVNECVRESSIHEVNVCLIGGAETNCTEKCPNGPNSHETCSCVIGGEENPLEEKIGDDVHKVIAHVSNVSVTGETGDDVTKMDHNDKDVYKTAVNESNISMTGAKEIAVKVDTTETADEICSSWANCHDSESSSDSKSDIQDTDIIITPSDTLEGDTGEVVHTTNAVNTSTGTTDVDICEDDCIVLGNSDDIQEKASCGTKEDKADPKYF